MGERSDAWLIWALLLGSEQERAEAVFALSPVIQYRAALTLRRIRWSAPPEEVKDLVQEIWLALFDRESRILKSWSAEKGLSLRNFLGLVTVRRTISALRRRSGRDDIDIQDVSAEWLCSPSAESGILMAFLAEALLSRLKRAVSGTAWKIYALRMIERKTIREIGDETGLSEDAVYQHVSRAKRKLREILKDVLSETGG